MQALENPGGMSRETLQKRIRTGIPIAAHMDFQVLEISPNCISVRGGANENVNVHGTAFAGSLYSICTLALWGLIHSRLPQHASLVMAKAGIHYVKPVVGEIISSCDIPAEQMDRFLGDVNDRGKGRLVATVHVFQNEALAVEFTGTVYARLVKA